jgi:hypothetical protein
MDTNISEELAASICRVEKYGDSKKLVLTYQSTQYQILNSNILNEKLPLLLQFNN